MITPLPPKNASNLARVAIGLLKFSPPPKFRMKAWARGKNLMEIMPHEVQAQKNECGTACCFAGHGPIFLPNSTRINEGWNDYADRVFLGEHIHPWTNDYTAQRKAFLFGGSWPDDKKQAARRALVVLNNHPSSSGDIDFGVTYSATAMFYQHLSDNEVIERLRRFVIMDKSEEYFPGDGYFKPGLRPCRGRV